MKGSSSKESCSWHHRSVTCQLFRFNYSFVWTFYPSCFLQDFGFVLPAALAGSTPAPAARNFARFQARPPGDTQLVAFAVTFSSAFGVRAHRSIIPTYSKQTCPENSAVQNNFCCPTLYSYKQEVLTCPVERPLCCGQQQFLEMTVILH